jgi:hypothetical protein
MEDARITAPMTNVRSSLGKKAARATLRHSVRGFASKAQRKPLRSATLLSTGGVLGAIAGWLAGRKSGEQ